MLKKAFFIVRDMRQRIPFGLFEKIGCQREYLSPLDGNSQGKGASYPDITATKDGRTIRINTVDVKKNGKPTQRELDNAERIRKQTPGDHLILIPKKA